MLEPAQGKKEFFFSFYFLFGHIINNLLTELGRSVWENLDLDRWYRPHCGRSVPGGGGTRYIKKVGMLVENFEIDP